ncbi:MAG: ribose-5-phosphate isomerase RpiA [Legionellaceae bacterium]|nr:ribose-5-phosphate isomerase RpiA [Legionellaceae bacterium]
MTNLKAQAAEAALEYIEDNMIIGVGTGSTVNYFIDALAKVKHRIEACVASSLDTERRLLDAGMVVLDLNVVGELPIYVDGADEVDAHRAMIKGGGGALTREKIIASASRQFVCIVDETKLVQKLGVFPVPVEVLPLARSFVARELVKLGGDPEYRHGFVTDNGNIILDVFNLDRSALASMEDAINLIPGVVDNGIFAKRLADKVLIAGRDGVRLI